MSEAVERKQSRHGEWWAIVASLSTALAVLLMDGTLSLQPGVRWVLGGVFAFCAIGYTVVAAVSCHYEWDRD